ncbi:MAG: glycosyltransferase family 4 protein [Xanthobacteraceae bacterium]
MNKMRFLGTSDRKLDRPLRVTMLGLRGFPDVQGGVERHVQNLSCALVDRGCDVEAIMRSPYVVAGLGRKWRNVRVVTLWSPRISGVEAVVHTFFGVLRAAWSRPDILHLHAIGPALFAPLARAMALRVVVTHHSDNYDNPKWNLAGRMALRLGEWAGITYANGYIGVSQFIADRIRRSYGVDIRVIPNGVDAPVKSLTQSVLDELGLTPHRYVLSVARIDPIKRLLDLVSAFARAQSSDWKLVLVGDTYYSSEYAQALAKAVSNVSGVIMLGYQSPAVLAQLYAHAAVFVLPSKHEGNPIALLEALSYGIPAIVSDIPSHRDIDTPLLQRVPVGDIDALSETLRAVFTATAVKRMDATERERFLRKYDWSTIAESTLGVYLNALDETRPSGFGVSR